jgi:hypothetical protein
MTKRQFYLTDCLLLSLPVASRAELGIGQNRPQFAVIARRFTFAGRTYALQDRPVLSLQRRLRQPIQ